MRDGDGNAPPHIRWERESGPPEEVDVFPFEVHTASEEGEYPFETNQIYSDGDTVHWDGPEDSPTPAPLLAVAGN